LKLVNMQVYYLGLEENHKLSVVKYQKPNNTNANISL